MLRKQKLLLLTLLLVACFAFKTAEANFFKDSKKFLKKVFKLDKESDENVSASEEDGLHKLFKPLNLFDDKGFKDKIEKKAEKFEAKIEKEIEKFDKKFEKLFDDKEDKKESKILKKLEKIVSSEEDYEPYGKPKKNVKILEKKLHKKLLPSPEYPAPPPHSYGAPAAPVYSAHKYLPVPPPPPPPPAHPYPAPDSSEEVPAYKPKVVYKHPPPAPPAYPPPPPPPSYPAPSAPAYAPPPPPPLYGPKKSIIEPLCSAESPVYHKKIYVKKYSSEEDVSYEKPVVYLPPPPPPPLAYPPPPPAYLPPPPAPPAYGYGKQPAYPPYKHGYHASGDDCDDPDIYDARHGVCT